MNAEISRDPTYTMLSGRYPAVMLHDSPKTPSTEMLVLHEILLSLYALYSQKSPWLVLDPMAGPSMTMKPIENQTVARTNHL